jgi:hypothetical protein
MKNPLQQMLEAGVIPSASFPQNSRYAGTATQTYTFADGRTVAYLARRLVPDPSLFAAIGQVPVRKNDRLDLIASTYLGDPILFWRIADANGAVRPADLLQTEGRILRITLPQAVSGGSGA